MLSVLIPFHNEKDSLPLLLDSLRKKLLATKTPYEIILIDDGSLDNYDASLSKVLENDARLIVLNRQMGKGRALAEGVKQAKGELIAFMDADLQDDPDDLSKFLTKLNEGYDLVNGYREKRQDNQVVKIYSKLAKYFLQRFLSSPFTDINCGFKVLKRGILENIPLYGNNFRFMPLAAFYEGYKVAEVLVKNNPRRFGVSKFGSKKLFIGVVDVLSAYFVYKFAERPMHFFGSVGIFFILFGALALTLVTFERIYYDILLYRRPLFQYAIFSVILGLQILATGIIGELIVYLHHKKKNV